MMKKFAGLKLATRIAVMAFALFFSTAVICTAADGILQVTIEKDAQNPIEGVTAYLFSESGTYLNQNQVTDSVGKVAFNLSEGSYKIRADYLGYQFWSQVYSIDGDISETFTIAHQDVAITVQGEYQGMQSLTDVPVYLFTEPGTYLSQVRTTNANGQVFFSLPQQSYKVRADYLGRQFWSDPFTWQNTPVTIPMSDAEITVTGAGLPLEGVNVYVFSSSGSYLSISNTTGSDGKVTFRLPAGAYKFRADYQSSQYWSNEEILIAGQVNPISISTGGGTLIFTVLKSPGNPLTGVNGYVFSQSGTYLGMTAVTDSNGQVAFNLSDGSYKIRVDYLGYQFWSPVYSIDGNISETFTIAHQDVTLTVQGEYQGMQPLSGVPVYLFTESGAYLNQVRTANENGQVFFNLPEQSYKVRADYLGRQFWSDPFIWQNTPVTVPMADAEITVTGAGLPLEGVNVYVFSSSGNYLSITNTTGSDGKVTFRLPAGAYKFRADYQSSQYWTNEETLIAGQVNPISISSGGGILTFTALKSPGNPLSGVNGYVFSEAGTYLGMTATTDSNGQVAFNLSDGNYKIRVDYMGYQFWSPVYSVTGDMSETFTIAHQDVILTVQGEYQGMQPLADLPVYLFTESGAYQSQSQTTDGNGQVVFNLPQQSYKVRADYLGRQFWSDPFTWQNTQVTIDEGIAEIHITRSGSDVSGARVYLFSETGSYLSRFETTDATGKVQFLLPNRTYKFRADEGSDQTWSSDILIAAGTVNNVSIDFSPVSVTIDADPESIHTGQSSTLTWSSTNADSATIDQGIGTVPVSGSTAVSPTETTTYTITVTGTQGSAVASTTVTVTNNPPIAVDDLASTDEDTPITAIEVLVNDSDPDDDTISISDFTQPSHGTTGSNGDGTLTYTPDADYNGSDSFTYTITDGTAESAPATVNVTINPVNDPPVANAGTDQSVNTGDTVNLDGTLSSDVDGNNLNYQWSFVTLPSGSSAALSDPAAANPTFTADVAGTYELQLVVNDGTVDSPPDMVTITATDVILYPPTISIIEPDGVGDVAHTAFTVRWNDADPDTNASIALYYDTNSSGADGTLIVGGLSENPDSAADDSYVWNTGGLPDASYYIYAVIDDGVHDPVVNYSSGVVTIDHTYPAVTEEKQTAGDLSRSEHAVAIDGDSAIAAKIGAVSFYQRSGTEWIEQSEFTSAELGIDTISIQADIDGEIFVCNEPAIPSGQVIELNTNPIANFFNLRIGHNLSDGDILITSIELFMNDTWILKNSDIDWDGYDIYYQPEEGWVIPADSFFGADLVSRFGWGPGNMATKMRITFEKRGTSMSDFDTSVAISGDFAVMGMPFYGFVSPVLSPGCAFVFKREGATWVFHSKLTPIDEPENGYFGHSVAIDGNTIAVGGPETGDSYTGAVYIFKFNGAYWAQEAKLFASDAASGSSFGCSVGLSSDSLIVGACQAMYDGIQSGAAYVFAFDGNNWVEQAKLGPDSPSSTSYFGGSVDIDGDTVLIGSKNATNGGVHSGLAYVFNRNGSTWSQQALLTSGDAAEGDTFGQSVSVSGDHAIIGAPKAYNGGFQWGAAYLFKRNGVFWEELAKLVPTDTTEYISFAHAVSIDGDTTMVGRLKFEELEDEGSVYFYTIPAVSVKLAAEPESSPDGQFTLTWESENADTCVIEPGVGTVAANGSTPVTVTDTTTFTITATGIYGTATDEVTVRVGVPQPTVSISSDQTDIAAGETVNLSWTSTGAASVSIEPGIGNVALNGGTTVSPVNTTTYTITASGPGGLAADTVAINVVPKPSVALTTDPYSIYIGESIMLYWDTDYADSATIDQGIGSVNLSGSMTIYPTESTTYTLTAIGPGGTSSVSTYVTVQCPPPGVTLTADPETIYEGESSTLTWNTTYTDSVTIEPDVGSVGLNGNTLVSPTVTTDYTLTAAGPCGSTQRSVTITVRKPPGIYYEYDALGRIIKIIRIPKQILE
ncbi:MAG: Ig-like domain-containing protein [Thermodesulfobacteriota bacterium]|nr:Ig-like domain-containing protein [Thermodesulfobacteriota bacterium]